MMLELGSSERPLEVMVVEDNDADVRLVRETIKESTYNANVTVCRDGEQALLRLRKQGGFSGAPRPDLILLDLKLPKKSGEDVLKDIYADPGLKTIPIVILTGTEADEEMLARYKIPSNRYYRKPITLANFNNMVADLKKMGKEPIRLWEAPKEEKKRKWLIFR